MTDDQTNAPVLSASSAQPQQPAQAELPTRSTTEPAPANPMDTLEDLLAKAKARRNQGDVKNQEQNSEQPLQVEPQPEQLPSAGTSPEQQQAELDELNRRAEAEQTQKIEEQKQKMEELKQSPEFLARQQQQHEDAKKAEEQQATQQGHVIHQVGETKV